MGTMAAGIGTAGGMSAELSRRRQSGEFYFFGFGYPYFGYPYLGVLRYYGNPITATQWAHITPTIRAEYIREGS